MQCLKSKLHLILCGVKQPSTHTISIFRNAYLFLSTGVSCMMFVQSPTTAANLQQLHTRLKHYYEQLDHPTQQKAVSTPSDAFTVLGRWAWGPCVGVDVKGSYAYIGNGPTFDVLDVSNPSSPKIVGEYLTDGLVGEIRVRDSLAFLSTGGELLILDISDPTLPTKVGSVITYAGSHLALGDSLAFMTSLGGWLLAVDISDPAHPYLRGYTDAGGEFPFLAVSGHFAYTGSYEMWAAFVTDASNPDSLVTRPFAGIPVGFGANVHDTLLFIDRYIFSISHPDSPYALSGIDYPGGWVLSVSAQDSTAYVAVEDSGIFAVNIAHPTTPHLEGNILSPALSFGTEQTSIIGHLLCAASYAGLTEIDITRPDSLEQFGLFPTGGQANKVIIRRSLAFIACDMSGLWILDISDPSRPHGVGNVVLGGDTYDVQVSDNYAYVVNWQENGGDTTRGLWIIDISDSTHPTILSHYIGISRFPAWDIPNTIAKAGGLILMTQAGVWGTDSSNVLEIIDVSDPRHPQQAGVWGSTHRPSYVAVKDSFAFIMTDFNSMKVVDFHTPSNPVEISSVPVIDFAVQVKDTLAYTSSYHLSVLDIANPDSAFVLSSVQTHSSSSYNVLKVDGHWAYWAEGILGIVDISDPHNPVPAGSFTGYDYGDGVAARNNIVLYSDNAEGVWILRNNLITVPQIYSLADGWNMISVPGVFANRAKNVLFPTAISSAFAYSSGYEIVDTLQSGSGYWMKFDSSQSLVVTGLPVYSETITVEKGWNIIGSISVPVPISNISSIPGGMTTSSFFGYDGSYHIYDTIKSGHGYWVRTNESGSLILSGNPFSSMQSRSKIVISPLTETPPPPPSAQKNELNLPTEYALQQPYPNPFNPTTTIRYQLPIASRVTLRVYNTLGQIVATLVERTEKAGFKQVEWNAASFASGIYFCRLDAVDISNLSGIFVHTNKMVLLK